ncbi:hypothetical protein CU669_10085 [Paramagnetospirillum kuznetsovii]|uniref:Tryptophan synthase subunit beta like protein n=1 Tax=Paramagnetospirillum kuznetsovii TaxID=2053833 RepID=A0A364NYQ2_9PROT|nr:hypothetical protein [Paramagnetospirillum kuznetsovii]RAU22035.1 hypothetical protein CU669_10085 [Paramagnetospirillum kuznetsovii]
MPYVSRDIAGKVIGLSEDSADGASENLPASHPDVLDFLFRDTAGDRASSRFLASDLGFIRVVEDLVAVLIEKRVITFTDLPAPAQDKLLGRRSLRSYLSDVSGVFENGEGKII